MPTYKLLYFNLRGRAETARQMFEYGDIKYEDVRIDNEEWINYKAKMPFGQIPVLEVDGKVIHQSGAINRLIAKRVGLYGKDDMECAVMDVIIETCAEVWKFYPSIYKESDPVKKAAAQKNISEVLLPPYLDYLERCVGHGSGFLVGGRMTLADLYFLNEVLLARSLGVTVNLDNHPKLKALEKAVTTHPKIAASIAKRPKTIF